MPRLLNRFVIFSLRVLLLSSPQVLVSVAAIQAYIRASIMPSTALGVHVAAITTAQIVFFSLWALAVHAPGVAARKWIRGVFAATLVLKCLSLNFVYVLSYASYQLWGAYITWQNVSALAPHLQGFYRALGGVFVFAAMLTVAGIAAGYLGLYKLTRRLLHWLQWSYADRSSRSFSVILAGLSGLLVYCLWFVTLDGDRLKAQDPIYAFWHSAAHAKPVLTPEMLADQAAHNYDPPAQFNRRNVIVIIVDCLRADHLSFRGYQRETTPFLDALARAGRFHQVDFAMANGNDSPQGIRAILGSRYPHHHNIHNFKLHDALKRAGYRTHLIATGDHTTLRDMRRHYGPNFDVFSDGLSSVAYSVNDDRSLLEALDRIPASDGQPAFFFFHLMSAHSLGVREMQFQRWNPSLLKLDWGAMVTGRYNPELMINSYDNGLYQADHYLRRIFGELEAKGYMQDYIGALTGDHGEGLGERGHYGHTRFLYMEDLRVPILFFESGDADYGPMPFGSHVDIAPTILARLKLPIPARWAGRSLYQGSPPQAAYAVSSRDNTWWAVVMQRDDAFWKYLLSGTAPAGNREFLFNLTMDPGEQTNLLANTPTHPLAAEMRQMAVREFNGPIPSR